MTRRIPMWVRSARAFFGSAIFRSLFCTRELAPKTIGGLATIAAIATISAANMLFMTRTISGAVDVFNREVLPNEAERMTLTFAGIFIVFGLTEYFGELVKRRFSLWWTVTAVRWYSDNWIAAVVRNGGQLHVDKVGERILDRPWDLPLLLVPVYIPLCRSLVIVCIFGWFLWSLGESMFPMLATTVPGWLLGTMILAVALETYFSIRLGKRINAYFDEYRKKRGDHRKMIDVFESDLLHGKQLTAIEAVGFRKESRHWIESWAQSYDAVIHNDMRLVAWRTINQQLCQFALWGGLPYFVMTKQFTAAIWLAAIFAIDNMRGAALTISNAWPEIQKAKGIVEGLKELESEIELAAAARRRTLKAAE